MLSLEVFLSYDTMFKKLQIKGTCCKCWCTAHKKYVLSIVGLWWLGDKLVHPLVALIDHTRKLLGGSNNKNILKLSKFSK